jgi:hypothetical protein
MLWMLTVVGAAQTVIDNFQTNQTSLTLAAPGADGSTAAGSMLGAERDLRIQLTSGGPMSAGASLGTFHLAQASGSSSVIEISWDGADGDASTLNSSGLGGINLSAGSQNAFLLGLHALDQSVDLTLTVYSGANSSVLTLPLPGGLVAPQFISLPFNAFVGTANFASVGAIKLAISASSATNVVLDFLRTTDTTVSAPVGVTLTDVVLVDTDNNGKANAGDRLRYVMRVSNASSSTLSNVLIQVPSVANTVLAAGSITVTPIARDDGPTDTSAPGDPMHGALNATYSLDAVHGVLSNDFSGTPVATITHFGGGSLGGSVTDHTAGSSASVASGTLTLNADGSLTFIPNSTFVGLFSFQYRLANSQGTDDANARIAVGVRPTAVADARNVTGNVKINSALIPFSLLDNDAGSGLTVSTFQTPSTQGGTVSVSANGQFTYDPPAGYLGSDTFTYTLSSGFGTSQATVTLTIADRLWFINNSGAPGDGRLSAPFNSLNAFLAVNNGATGHPAAGESVFLYTGTANYSVSSLALLAGQRLIGQGSSGTLAGWTGITFAPGSEGLPLLSGSDPIIESTTSHAITLAQNNTLRGFTAGNTPNGYGFYGVNAGSFTVNECSKIGTGGALSLGSGTTANATFETLSSVNASAQAIDLTGVNGTIQTTLGSISAPVGTAVRVIGGNVNLTYPGAITKNNSGRLIDIENRSSGTIVLSGDLNQNNAGATGILLLTNTGGTITFSGSSKVLSTYANNAVTLNGNNGATIQLINGGLDIDTTTGVACFAAGGGTCSVSGSGNTITATGNAALSLSNITLNASFDSVSSSGGAINLALTNTAGTITISGGALSGGTASSVLVNGGTVSLTYEGNITQANNAPLLSVLGGHSGTLQFQTGNLDATLGAGLQFDNADGTYQFSGTTTLHGGSAAIDIVNGSSGTFYFGADTSITNPSGPSFYLLNSGANVTYSGNLTDNTDYLIDIDNHDAGTITFQTGSITSTAMGIRVQNCNGGTLNFNNPTKTLNTAGNSAVTLSNNTGATIVFGSGGLDIDTTSGAGFSATGGGTISITGSGNSINSTGAAALNVQNTTIAAAGLNFVSVSAGNSTIASDPVHGVVLNNTGALGGLTVAGAGSAGSGGTIQNCTGDGISLISTASVSLSRMNIQNNLGNGIYGAGVTGFNLSFSTVDNNADDAALDEAGIRFENLLGTASITDTTVANSIEDNVRIINTSGTLTLLTMSNCTIRDTETVSPGNNGLLLEADGTATMSASIINSSFLRNRANGVQATANDAGTITINVGNGSVGSGGTFEDNNIGVNFAHNSSGTMTFNVQHGTFNAAAKTGTASPINLNLGGSTVGSSLMHGTVSLNSIANHNSLTGPGIRVLGNGAGTMTIQLDQNQISQIAHRGIEILARDGSSTINATVTGNTITLTDPAAADGIRIDAGAVSTDTTTINADIRSNVSTTIPGFYGLRVRQRFTTTTFRLEGYSGSAVSDAAVVAFLSAANNGATTSADHGGSGFQFISSVLMP